MSEPQTRDKVLADRLRWAKFLMQPGRKKGCGWLDAGDGIRCCFGHGAFALGIERHQHPQSDRFVYGEERHQCEAPIELVERVGLYDDLGSIKSGASIEIAGCSERTLAATNDFTDVTMRQIGKYLLAKAEGGDATPFRPLTEFCE